MRKLPTSALIAACTVLVTSRLGAADRPPIDLKPASAQQVLNHHLLRSARIGTAQADDGRVPLMPWRTTDDVVGGWDWSLPPGTSPVPRSGLIFSRSKKRYFPGNRLSDIAVYWRDVEPEEVGLGRRRQRWMSRPVRNFERWLIQRDRDGYRTRPAIKATQHEMMWMVPKDRKFDFIARRTDRADGQSRIGFALDDRFAHGGPHRVAIKVTYHDIGRGDWALIYTRPDGARGRRRAECRDSGKVLTATFFLDDACFPGKGEAFDFHVEARGADATVSFVRVIKLPGQTNDR